MYFPTLPGVPAFLRLALSLLLLPTIFILACIVYYDFLCFLVSTLCPGTSATSRTWLSSRLTRVWGSGAKKAPSRAKAATGGRR
jgi:hypothetical protein